MRDIVGKTVGMWTIFEDTGVRNKHRYCKCRCTKCGNEKEYCYYHLVRDEPRCECLYVDAPKHHYGTVAKGIYDYLCEHPDSTMLDVYAGLEKFGYSYAEIRRTMLREKGKKIYVSGRDKCGKCTWRGY